MEQHIEHFKVENFKKFSSLEISNLGQFNLIVGDNNTGKTSALEAMVFDEHLPNYLYLTNTLLQWRNLENFDKIDFNYFNLIFHEKQKTSIAYAVCYKNQTAVEKFSYEIANFSTLTNDERRNLEANFFNKIQSKFVIKLIAEQPSHEVCFLKGYDTLATSHYLPFIPFNLGTDDLANLYSNLFQNSKSKRQNLLDYLRIFIPDLENIEVTNGIVPNSSTLCIWRSAFDEPFIINSFGEGTVRTLRILLEIAQCENKFLLLDEIESGIHYSRMDQFWEVLIKSAHANNVQITATTHSKECLISFKNSLAKLGKQDDGRIVRFVEHSGQIKAYTYNYEQFDQTLEYENEIR